jgi:Mg/Co/Ni transporter MgtE
MDTETQVDLIEGMVEEKASRVVEEMAADEAADLLGELEQETSEEILEEMESEPKAEVEELLEYDENSAGGMMTPDYLAVDRDATVADALEAVRREPDLVDNLNTILLTDADGRLHAALPVARVFLAHPSAQLAGLVAEGDTAIHVHVHERGDRVIALFDKYNLLTLPVLDEEGRLAGVVTADDIISALRQK